MSPEVSMTFGDDGNPKFSPSLPPVPAPAPPPPPPGVAAVVEAVEAVEAVEPAPELLPPPMVNALANQITQRAPVAVEVVERKKRGLKADNPWVLGLMLILVFGIAAASFYVSFNGLYAAAEWAVGAIPPLQFAVPFMLDVAIIAYTLALFVERERGKNVRGTWISIGLFAGVSAFANILHTLVVTTAVDPFQLTVGIIISGGAPLLLAFSTDKIAVTVFEQAEEGSLVRKLVLGKKQEPVSA